MFHLSPPLSDIAALCPAPANDSRHGQRHPQYLKALNIISSTLFLLIILLFSVLLQQMLGYCFPRQKKWWCKSGAANLFLFRRISPNILHLSVSIAYSIILQQIPKCNFFHPPPIYVDIHYAASLLSILHPSLFCPMLGFSILPLQTLSFSRQLENNISQTPLITIN